jgi:hypothetical protein
MLGLSGQSLLISFSVISCRDPLFYGAIVRCSLVPSAASSPLEFQTPSLVFMSEPAGTSASRTGSALFSQWPEIMESNLPLYVGRKVRRFVQMWICRRFGP